MGFVRRLAAAGVQNDRLPQPRAALAAEDAPGEGTERAAYLRVLAARGRLGARPARGLTVRVDGRRAAAAKKRIICVRTKGSVSADTVLK